MKAYKLLKDIPGAEAGTVFLHDKKDSNKGSIGCGCLKNVWEDGNVQNSCIYVAEVIVFPGQLINDKEWFVKIKNKNKKYYLHSKYRGK
jgi:hypothetical protein